MRGAVFENWGLAEDGRILGSGGSWGLRSWGLGVQGLESLFQQQPEYSPLQKAWNLQPHI